MNTKINTVIIGGGPAGSFLAILLAKQGHQVTLFEKKKVLKRKICGEYLCPRGVELLQKKNLAVKILKDFLPIQGMILSSPQGMQVKCTFPKTDQTWIGSSLNRQIFDQRLLDEASSYANVEIRYGVPITHILKEGEQWRLDLGTETLHFDLLVAADSRVSSIAKILGHAQLVDTSRVAVHFYLSKREFLNCRYGEMHIFHDGSYCGLDPIRDDEVNVSFVFDSKKLKNRSLAQVCNDYFQQSKRLVQMFGEIPEQVSMKAITPITNDNSFVAGQNMAYVGDAAGFIDPLTGEGIYNALLSSHLLAEAIEKKNSLPQAIKSYKNTKKKIFFQKKVLNRLFQGLIKRPGMCLKLAKFLGKNEKRANIFIGIIGNIDTPLMGMIKMLWA